MFAGILILVVFLVMAGLMMTKKLPSLVALPLMAILIAVVGGLPATGEQSIIDTVVVEGTLSMAPSYVAILLSCWLAQLLYRTGVTNTMVKKAAELGGDKPFVVCLLLCAVSVVLFTVLIGTGAAAMVGAIVIPIMISVGVPAITAANLFLMSLCAGYAINPANMTSLLNITGLQQSDITPAAIILTTGCSLFILVHLIVLFRKRGKVFAFAAPTQPSQSSDEEFSTEKSVKGVRGFLAALTPVIVVLLTLILQWNAMACFLIGVVWAVAMTIKGKWSTYMSMLTSAFNEGFKEGAPAAGLMFGIGMTLKAVSAPSTQAALMPFMSAITPNSIWALALFICILAPLTLYRGPLNVFGLGAGLLASMMAVGTVPTVVLGAMFYGATRWAMAACPTATQVVWTANFIGSDPVTTTKRVQLPNWILTIVTVVAIAIAYM